MFLIFWFGFHAFSASQTHFGLEIRHLLIVTIAKKKKDLPQTALVKEHVCNLSVKFFGLYCLFSVRNVYYGRSKS